MSYINIKDKSYPWLLANIHNPPENIYIKGNRELLLKRCITIVGTREATEYGKLVLNSLLKPCLKTLNISIVSGMAEGIDTLVHKKCLEQGISTIAVIAGGIDNIYPSSNEQLYMNICNNGLVIAEYDGFVTVKKGMFPMRNRILAGLSDTTIVIEADMDSGSLITANLALESGRDVYAIPGDIGRNTSRGCNRLIQQGVEVITSEEDFRQILGIEQEQLKMSI